jgi:hypothetical protein
MQMQAANGIALSFPDYAARASWSITAGADPYYLCCAHSVTEGLLSCSCRHVAVGNTTRSIHQSVLPIRRSCACAQIATEALLSYSRVPLLEKLRTLS